MSRWRNDPEAAAARLIAACLESIAVGGRLLLANPPAGGELHARLAERGDRCDVWARRLGDDQPVFGFSPHGLDDVESSAI